MFFGGLLLSQSLVWHSVNPLMYRMQLRNFLLLQPVMLLLSLPFELDACNWAAEQRPKIAATTFGGLARWGRVLMGGGTPQLLVLDTGKEGQIRLVCG